MIDTLCSECGSYTASINPWLALILAWFLSDEAADSYRDFIMMCVTLVSCSSN